MTEIDLYARLNQACSYENPDNYPHNLLTKSTPQAVLDRYHSDLARHEETLCVTLDKPMHLGFMNDMEGRNLTLSIYS